MLIFSISVKFCSAIIYFLISLITFLLYICYLYFILYFLIILPVLCQNFICLSRSTRQSGRRHDEMTLMTFDLSSRVCYTCQIRSWRGLPVLILKGDKKDDEMRQNEIRRETLRTKENILDPRKVGKKKKGAGQGREGGGVRRGHASKRVGDQSFDLLSRMITRSILSRKKQWENK